MLRLLAIVFVSSALIGGPHDASITITAQIRPIITADVDVLGPYMVADVDEAGRRELGIYRIDGERVDVVVFRGVVVAGAQGEMIDALAMR